MLPAYESGYGEYLPENKEQNFRYLYNMYVNQRHASYTIYKFKTTVQMFDIFRTRFYTVKQERILETVRKDIKGDGRIWA